MKGETVAKITRLIQQALTHGLAAHEAVSELVTIGMSAVPSVIEALRQLNPQENSVNLCRVLMSISDPDLVPTIVTILHEKNIDLVITAFRVLGYSHDPRAYEPLLDFMSDVENRDARRSLAANAIGELGNTQAIPVLLQVVDEAKEKKSYELALSAIIALAKLGNHEKGSLVIWLVSYIKDPVIQPRAAEALKYVVVGGLFQALRKVVRNKQVEVCLHGINALFYLGVKESIEELISLVKNKNPIISIQALARINDLTGEDFAEDILVKDLQNWWKANEHRFPEGNCLRLGKSIWLPDVIGLLAEPNIRERTVQELQMITGRNSVSRLIIPIREQEALLRNTQKWWEQEGESQFVAGHLYKYGYEQNLLDIF